MSIEFHRGKRFLILAYSPVNGTTFIREKLSTESSVEIKHRIFRFQKDDVFNTKNIDSEFKEFEIALESSEETYYFTLGHADGNFFVIPARILGIKFDLIISKTIPLELRHFLLNPNHSIFREIDRLVNEQIILVDQTDKQVELKENFGEDPSYIPFAEFTQLIKSLPNYNEIQLYIRSRFQSLFQEYFDAVTDAIKALQVNLARRKRPIETLLEKKDTDHLLQAISPTEKEKFKHIRDELTQMLSNPKLYLEKDWEDKILQFILILFPKYVSACRNVAVKKTSGSSSCFLDIALIDAEGTIDIIEIKRAEENHIFAPRLYRGNNIPSKTLAGTIMQAEKYIFHLSKSGSIGESKLTSQLKSQLPNPMNIKITNPKAMLVLGRDNDFNDQQKLDFEIIRRKYANMMDIITYDDLLRRVDNILSRFI